MVVVISAVAHGSRTRLLVAPITHSEPESGITAVEVPANVKRHLGLDHEQSWVILNELNRFIWPGPDVRITPGGNDPFYDAIPDWLFRRVRDGIAHLAAANRLAVTKRTE